ncbi:Acyl-CoA dehydrogenase [Nocardioides scoriae]|uniref:Acyl-CoA dehydrogenase n=1 Tax=Nocardioides scoriae TaxID=642780 RepID=A0A1H1N1N1_9ACTN|nr:hypothetical protein [Nocardioides scoriae]SDR93031.1 Acyl-CoA dehydrogenase [Nocardioides scoriae]
MTHTPVPLSPLVLPPERAAVAERLVLRAQATAAAPDRVAAALDLARDLSTEVAPPALGDTARSWEVLATLGAVDLTVARAVEPHLDALAILDQARREGRPRPDDAAVAGATWGVYAAEGPERLRAEPDGDGWRLSGPKAWCSLAARVSHALVTAWVDDERRGLFAVELRGPGVRLDEDGPAWVARGLAEVVSTGLVMDGAAARAVGGPGWYLDRPGFAWGGAGVAAVWYGGAVGVARRLRAAATRREPDQVALLHLGAIDAALGGARALLAEAAAQADGAGGPAGRDGPAVVAARVRQGVADAAAEVLDRTGRALGPGPLATDEEHARRVADLELYLRQHHGERDLAQLGRLLLDQGSTSW